MQGRRCFVRRTSSRRSTSCGRQRRRKALNALGNRTRRRQTSARRHPSPRRKQGSPLTRIAAAGKYPLHLSQRSHYLGLSRLHGLIPPSALLQAFCSNHGETACPLAIPTSWRDAEDGEYTLVFSRVIAGRLTILSPAYTERRTTELVQRMHSAPGATMSAHAVMEKPHMIISPWHCT